MTGANVYPDSHDYPETGQTKGARYRRSPLDEQDASPFNEPRGLATSGTARTRSAVFAFSGEIFPGTPDTVLSAA